MNNKRPHGQMKRALATLVLACWASLATAADVTVAVASNFVTTAFKLIAEFEGETGHSVAVGHGATGHLYTQIVRGAPFDVLLAGDDERPAMLLANGRATETRAYAVGHLALVSREPLTRKSAANVLEGRTVALADPIAAPYGKASTRAMGDGFFTVSPPLDPSLHEQYLAQKVEQDPERRLEMIAELLLEHARQAYFIFIVEPPDGVLTRGDVNWPKGGRAGTLWGGTAFAAQRRKA